MTLPDRDSDKTVPSCVDHSVGSLTEIWQDNYLSTYMTTTAATQPRKASGSQELVWRVRNPAIQRPMQQLPSPVSPSTIEIPLLSPLAPSLNGPSACVSGKPSVAPLHGFVQELIRRSCTSGTVLRATPYYIKAIRRKLPKIASAPVAPLKEIKPEEPPWGGRPAAPESPPHHHFSVPATPFSRPSSWLQSFSGIGATPTGLGKSFLVPTHAKLANSRSHSTMLWIGDFRTANKTARPIQKSHGPIVCSFK